MRRSMVGVVFAVVLMCGGHAHARPGDEAPRTEDREKSTLTAYLVTVASTALPLAIASLGSESMGTEGGSHEATLGIIGLAGLVLGPSGGQWYAGAGFTPGLGLRLGGVALAGALALRDPHLDHPTGTVIGLITAVVALEAGMVWDVLTLPRQVRRYNREHSLHVAPLITDRGPGPGVAIGGAF